MTRHVQGGSVHPQESTKVDVELVGTCHLERPILPLFTVSGSMQQDSWVCEDDAITVCGLADLSLDRGNSATGRERCERERER